MDNSITLGDVLKLELHMHAETCSEIVDRALKELNIEKTLSKIELNWSSFTLTFSVCRVRLFGVNFENLQIPTASSLRMWEMQTLSATGWKIGSAIRYRGTGKWGVRERQYDVAKYELREIRPGRQLEEYSCRFLDCRLWGGTCHDYRREILSSWRRLFLGSDDLELLTWSWGLGLKCKASERPIKHQFSSWAQMFAPRFLLLCGLGFQHFQFARTRRGAFRFTLSFQLSRWANLETIFTESIDIRKQLPDDSLRFETADADFKVGTGFESSSVVAVCQQSVTLHGICLIRCWRFANILCHFSQRPLWRRPPKLQMSWKRAQ